MTLNFGFARSSRYKYGRLVVAASIALTGTSANAFCWRYAAQYSHMPVELLKAIAMVESGCNPDAYHVNNNGTHDIGLMQINSVHLPGLRDEGISERALYDPCTNLLVGARILWQQVQRYGWSWEAIGAYHMPDSRYLAAQKEYAQSVWRGINSVRAHPDQCMRNHSYAVTRR